MNLDPRRPLSSTHGFARPPDNTATPVPGGLVWDAPSCRDAWFAHRLELDGPPADLGAAFALWDAHHAGKGIGRRFVCWETPLEAPWAEVPQRLAPERMVGIVRHGAGEHRSDTILPVREVGDLERLVAAAARQMPAQGPSYARYLGWLHRGLAAIGATTFAAFDGEEPVAAATVVPGPGGVWRFQEVWTDRAWRRRGLCAALVRRCLAVDPAGTFVIASVDGSDALRIYERLGFRRASRFVECSSPVEDAAPTATP